VASGQTVPLSGSGTTLAVLVAAYGTASGQRHRGLHRRSTQTFSLAFADWWSKSPDAGNRRRRGAAVHQQLGGKQTQAVDVLRVAPLQTGKTVQAVVLPNSARMRPEHHRHAHLRDDGRDDLRHHGGQPRAHANSQIVTADNAGASPLIANRAAIGAWEQFDLLTNSDGASASAPTRTTTRHRGQRGSLAADRQPHRHRPLGGFDLIRNADGSVSFRAHANNDMVTADNAEPRR